jgi:EAL domain-containing protein (putative c-di-GMP-specific phosphodiesterase class I)
MGSRSIELVPGEVLFGEGDAPTNAWLIESGTIEVYSGPAQDPIVLARLGAGDLLGEMAMIDDAPRTASARAIAPSRLQPIDREQLQQRIESADPVVRALLRAQLSRYRSALATFRNGGVSETLPLMPRANDAVDLGAMAKIRLEGQLMDALASRSLEVRYQPLLELGPDRIAGYEALVRWTHPERGAIAPIEFIQLAEETSLIVPVGNYVFESVCEVLARLQRSGVDPLPFVAINVSARQLEEPDLLDTVVAIAATRGIPLTALKIEITESLTLNPERVGALIARCHSLGMKVALDDFGTGHSNLGQLHTLHFDTVKLDQGFVRQMLAAPRCLAIVRAVVAMANSLDADLVAEGAETAEQIAALRDLGCRYAQGWGIGRPISSEDMLVQQLTLQKGRPPAEP